MYEDEEERETPCGLSQETLDRKGWVDHKQQCIARISGGVCGALYTAHVSTQPTENEKWVNRQFKALVERIRSDVAYERAKDMPGMTYHQKLKMRFSYSDRTAFDKMDGCELNLLNYACEGGDLRMTQVLIWVAGMSATAQSEDDETEPIHSAIEGGHLHIVEWLIDEMGVDLQLVDSKLDMKKNSLAKACLCGHLHIVKWLFEKYPKIFETHVASGMHCAIEEEELDCLRFCVKNSKLDIATAKLQDHTLLQTACGFGCLKSTQWLLAQPGMDVNVDGGSALFLACESKRLKMVKWLLDVGGADINLQCYLGISKRHCDEELEHFLWCRGAKVTQECFEDRYDQERLLKSLHNFLQQPMTCIVAEQILDTDMGVIDIIVQFALPRDWEEVVKLGFNF